ncbi:GNAT family N-acetyltransferase [Cognatiyoonia sp.]|uniref:GNAT family N-acetyltransferase n=1 Tax=Cognatiyoonia sp. TaxID=2211652 RepID=UPI003F6A0900
MDRVLGAKLPDFPPVVEPRGLHLVGTWAELRPLDVARDAPRLWAQMAGADWLWDYLFEPAPQSEAEFTCILSELAAKDDKFAYVIRVKGDEASLGYACFWTTVPAMGSNEIGNVNLSPAVQRTPVATEAFFLMNDWVFQNGYRRMEWKCNALNAPSRRAAERLGFSFEGMFRNHLVVKGRNRDTAWFAITDADWPALRDAYLTWLSPENFDAEGHQKQSLSSLTRPLLYATDPMLR